MDSIPHSTHQEPVIRMITELEYPRQCLENTQYSASKYPLLLTLFPQIRQQIHNRSNMWCNLQSTSSQKRDTLRSILSTITSTTRINFILASICPTNAINPIIPPLSCSAGVPMRKASR